MKQDQNGLLITSISQDGGDTLAEEGRYWFLYWFNFVFMGNIKIFNKMPDRGHPERIMDLLEVKPGIYVRNPAPNAWALWEKDPNTVSRDQLLPVIWYCAAFKDRKRLARLFWACLKRGMFAQNIYQNWYTSPPKKKLADQMLTCIGSFIRAGGFWTAILYPLLFLFDLMELFTVLMALLPIKMPDEDVDWKKPSTWLRLKKSDDVDDNNLDISLLAAVRFKPTPISWFNRILWGQCRTKNDGNALGYTNNCLAAMARYHSPDYDGNQEVVTLYSAPIEKYLKKTLK